MHEQQASSYSNLYDLLCRVVVCVYIPFDRRSTLHITESALMMQIVPEVESFTGGNGVRFVDGNKMAFDAVIFATGYRSNVPFWLKVRTCTSSATAANKRTHSCISGRATPGQLAPVTDVGTWWARTCMQDDGDLFTEDGTAKQAAGQPSGGDWWRGPNGLYRVGFSGRGLLGAGADALRAAADIAGRWQAEVAAAGGAKIVSSSSV